MCNIYLRQPCEHRPYQSLDRRVPADPLHLLLQSRHLRSSSVRSSSRSSSTTSTTTSSTTSTTTSTTTKRHLHSRAVRNHSVPPQIIKALNQQLVPLPPLARRLANGGLHAGEARRASAGAQAPVHEHKHEQHHEQQHEQHHPIYLHLAVLVVALGAGETHQLRSAEMRHLHLKERESGAL